MKYFFILLLIWMALLIGCNKETAFLDQKVNIAQSIPSSLTDYQNLLNNEDAFNYLKDPALGALTAEDYYVSNTNWTNAVINARNAYIFASDIYQGTGSSSDWANPYKAIYIANVVLDGMNKLKDSISSDGSASIKGQALYYRSWHLYNLLQTFSMPYDSISATSDLGIPLRLTSDFNVPIQRSTVQQCYDQILADLHDCIQLLPWKSAVATRPNKVATYALLARIYLALSKYSESLKNVDSVLTYKSDLLDYNNVSTIAYPNLFTSFVSEDIYHSTMLSYSFIIPGYSYIDSTIYNSYDSNDLRKSVFFVLRPSGILTYRGSYDYRGAPYSGLAIDEMYLIQAECLARLGNTTAAMNTLNALLVKRWKKNTFHSYTSSSPDSALDIILLERRKELINRGLRWTDLRRLNKDKKRQITLTRSVNGNIYTLPANDKRYAMPIPISEIELMGLKQNER